MLQASRLQDRAKAPESGAGKSPGQDSRPGVAATARRRSSLICPLSSVLCPLISGPLPRPGGHSAEVPPDPIPNSAVKLRRAQGTAPKGVGERVAARSSQGSRDQRSEIRDQRSEIRDQRPEIRDQRSEIGRLRQTTEIRAPRSDPSSAAVRPPPRAAASPRPSRPSPQPSCVLRHDPLPDRSGSDPPGSVLRSLSFVL
jgi:hypothetical protein